MGVGDSLWSLRFLSITTHYSFLMILLIFALYVIGNFQDFSDANQFFLLKVLDVYSYFYFFLALVLLIATVLLNPRPQSNPVAFHLKSLGGIIIILVLYMGVRLLVSFFS